MITTIGDMRDSSKQEMVALYGPSFQYPDGELRKSQESMELNSQSYYGNQGHQHTSGLTRYRSAPSAFFDSLITCSNGLGDSGGSGGDKDYRFCRSSSPEMDTMLDRFLSPGTCSGGSNSRDFHVFEVDKSSASVKREASDPDFAFPCSFRFQNLGYMNGGTSIERSFGIVGTDGTVNHIPTSSGSTANVSNPSRQNSSPAFFSNLGVNNGFSLVWESGSSKPSNSTGGESSSQQSRMSNHINFSLGSMYAPQISHTTDENLAGSSRDDAGNSGKRPYSSALQNLSWDDISVDNSLKKSRDDHQRSFSLLGSSDNLSEEDSGNRITGLTHHLSLPKTYSEMATMEKLFQLQGSVPCKIRAKRGFATHPRSIAERQRRTRISERMRKLQNLFPNMDKQTSTADMLELAVEHIKDLQNQVQALKETKARCTCSTSRKQCSNEPGFSIQQRIA